MKKTGLLAVAVIFLMGSFITGASAGVEPSPFTPEINQLSAVENGLNSCFDRINKVLATPPDYQEPSPDLNGAINRLEAIDGQINSLNDFVANTILSVMGVEPSPFREDVITSLYQVKAVSDDIVNTTAIFLDMASGDIHPDFVSAVDWVYGSATTMSGDIEYTIEQLSATACTPTDLEEYLCLQNACNWIIGDSFSGSFCCCPSQTAP